MSRKKPHREGAQEISFYISRVCVSPPNGATSSGSSSSSNWCIIQFLWSPLCITQIEVETEIEIEIYR